MARQQRRSKLAPRGGKDIVFTKQQKSRYRHFLLGIFAAYTSYNVFKPMILPCGEASPRDPIKYASLDSQNKLLVGTAQKIYPDPPVPGAETIIFDSKKRMYVVTEDAKLYQVKDFRPSGADSHTINATSVYLKDLGMGRPLGGRFAAGDTLYVADALLGLIRIRNVHDPKSKVELVVSSVDDTKILYADDVIIGPKTGKVYFTDASDIAPGRVGVDTWDTLYASKLDLMSGRGTGRLIEYDPKSDETKVLAKGLYFANGIGVDAKESSLIFAETFGIRLTKYSLETGELSTLIDSEDLPGYLDGVDCGPEKCYTVMPSAIVPLHKVFNALPEPLSQLVRTMLMALPKSLAPPVKKFGGIIEYDLTDGSHRKILDPKGDTISMLTGVTLQNGKLYLGSLQNDYIGVFDPTVA